MDLALFDWIVTHGLTGGALLAVYVLWKQLNTERARGDAIQQQRIDDLKKGADATVAANDKLFKAANDLAHATSLLQGAGR